MATFHFAVYGKGGFTVIARNEAQASRIIRRAFPTASISYKCQPVA